MAAEFKYLAQAVGRGWFCYIASEAGDYFTGSEI